MHLTTIPPQSNEDMMPPTRLDYCTAKFFPTVMDTMSAPPKMVKNYMNESYEKKDVVKNATEKIY